MENGTMKTDTNPPPDPFPADARIASTPEVRVPKNATLPVSEPIVFDIAASLPANPIPHEAAHDCDWGRVERTGTVLRITPSKPGEHEYRVSVDTADGSRHSAIVRLTVNPDPKSLWKTLEPPRDAPYWKPHSATVALETKCVRVVGASRRGRSHEDHGGFRDDDLGVLVDRKHDVFLLAVADGAGSAAFSREGSRLAVESALDSARQALFKKSWPDDLEEVGKVLMRAAYAGFQSIVKTVEESNKATGLEARPLKWKDFNTTLLLAAVKRQRFGKLRIATFSIGDGAMAWVSPKRASLLCRLDSGDAAGETRFLTMNDVWKKASEDWESFRKRIFTFEVPKGEAKTGSLFLMTDGVSDPFFETEDDLSDAEQWKAFGKGLPTTPEDLSGQTDPEDEAKRLFDWLSFYREGSHDDRTILCLRPTPKPFFAKRSTPEDKETSDAD